MNNCLNHFSSGNLKVSELLPYHQIVVEGEPIMICCDTCEYGKWFLNGVELDHISDKLFISISNYKHSGEYLYVGMTSNVEFKASVTVVCTFYHDTLKNCICYSMCLLYNLLCLNVFNLKLITFFKIINW